MEEMFFDADLEEMDNLFKTIVSEWEYNKRMNNWVTNSQVGFKRIYDWEEDEDLIL